MQSIDFNYSATDGIFQSTPADNKGWDNEKIRANPERQWRQITGVSIMNIASKFAAAALIAAAAALPIATPANADNIELSKPAAGATLFFADRYATAYYTTDGEDFRTVVTIAPGPNQEGNPMRFVNSLSDGETAEVSIGGYGDNAILVKLELARSGDVVQANVVTEQTRAGS